MRSDYVIVLLDVLPVAAAFTSMLVLRFDGSVPSSYWADFRVFLPIAIGVSLLSNWAFGLYGQLWRHASMHEAKQMVLAGSFTVLGLLPVEAIERRMPVSVIFTGTV